MYTQNRLTEVFRSSEEISFDDHSRFIFFSDCHRGDNSRADNFAPNKDIFAAALKYYYAQDYTYIEIGDGDELWENARFSAIAKAHGDIYLLMRNFYRRGRFYWIWGNHDIYKNCNKYIKENLYEFYNPSKDRFEPLFDGVKIRQGLILRYKDTPNRIFVVHGHQGDLLNDRLWPVSCVLVRCVWRRMEYLKFRNPFSPSSNLARMYRTQREIIHWVRKNRQMVIAGHTHQCQFARPGDIPYFNDGCCTRAHHITGIEIADNQIMLVKWYRSPEKNGSPEIMRKVIAGPECLQAYFKNENR